MTDYLLDTNIIKYWYDDGCSEHAKVMARVQAVRQADPQTGYVPRLFISVVTVGEIEYGHKAAPTPDLSKQAEYVVFMRDQSIESLDLTRHVGGDYGRLRAWLFNTFYDKKAKPKRPEQLVDPVTARELGVQENDIWIAAQAIALDMVLVTHDCRLGDVLRRFAAIWKLKWEPVDWAE
jgi:predicted nucleic acid-binding protein